MESRPFAAEDQRWHFNEEDDVKSRVIAWSDQIMLMEWTFGRKGTVLPLHSHMHEQISYVVKGSMEVTHADGSVKVYRQGDAVYFAPDEIHGLTVLEDCTIAMDVFSPLREDHLARHTEKQQTGS